MPKKNPHEGSSLDSMFKAVGELREVREIASRKRLDALRDATAERDIRAGIGIPLDEAFSWLHDRVDGIDRPKPKTRKF